MRIGMFAVGYYVVKLGNNSDVKCDVIVEELGKPNSSAVSPYVRSENSKILHDKPSFGKICSDYLDSLTVEQLFDYPSAVRKIMYTTNAIEAVNSSFLTISITSKNVTRKQIRGSELAGYFLEIPDGIKFPAVYIPVKDMLTHSAGFLAMANKYRDFPFDKTLTDIVIKASQWKVKQPPKLALAILPILEEMMDGTIVFENDEFYIKKNNGQMILFLRI